jgi:hypothetical protein
MNAAGLKAFQGQAVLGAMGLWEGLVEMDGVSYEAAVLVGRRMVEMRKGGEVVKRTITVQVLKSKLRERPVSGVKLTDKKDPERVVYVVDEVEGDRAGCPCWVLRGVEVDR